MNEITIFLTPLDAEQFILFQKHYKVIHTLITSGAFDIKNGSITINFNGEGVPISTDEKRHKNLPL